MVNFSFQRTTFPAWNDFYLTDWATTTVGLSEQEQAQRRSLHAELCSQAQQLSHQDNTLVIPFDVHLAARSALRSLPEGMCIYGNLFICDWKALGWLPMHLQLGGDVEIINCPNLRNIPSSWLKWPAKSDGRPHQLRFSHVGFNVATKNSILQYLRQQVVPGITIRFESLPPPRLKQPRFTYDSLRQWAYAAAIGEAEQQERQDLMKYILRKARIRNHTLYIESNFYISKYAALNSLPAGLYVQGKLQIDHCGQLHSVNQIFARKGVVIKQCPRLVSITHVQSLEQPLQIEACETLGKLAHINAYPSLSIRNCPLLLHCDRVVVGDTLQLKRQPMLFPFKSVHVGRLVHVNDCPDITEIPQAMLQWPANFAQGRLLEIKLDGCGITTASWLGMCQWINNHPAQSGVYLSNTEYDQLAKNELTPTHSLQAYLAYWHDGSLYHPSVQQPHPFGDFAYHEVGVLLVFLHKAFKLSRQKRQFVLEFKQLWRSVLPALADSDFRPEAIAMLEHASQSCLDGMLRELGEIALLWQVSRTPPEQLYRLGMGLMKLEMVRRHAAAWIKAHSVTDKKIDELQIYLSFEMALATLLGLPIQTQTLIHPSNKINQAEIKRVQQKVESAATDPMHIAQFFQAWEPWQRKRRTDLVEITRWEQLTSADEGLHIGSQARCCFTLGSLEQLKQPVWLPATAAYPGVLAEFDDFAHWWAQRGTHPLLPCNRVELTQLRRVRTAGDIL